LLQLRQIVPRNSKIKDWTSSVFSMTRALNLMTSLEMRMETMRLKKRLKEK
jgi:chorismate-pyruvate lyase